MLLKEIYPGIPNFQDSMVLFSNVGKCVKINRIKKLYASRVPKTIAKFSDLLEEVIGLESQYT